MDPILIPEIPSSIRKPGKYFAYDTRFALRNLPANPQKVLLIGQRLAAGSVAALVPTEIFNSADAAEYFGEGSMLALMCEAAIRANGYAYLTAIAFDDAGAGVAATGSVAITGPATGPGVATIWIGNRKFEVAVATDDTATAIGDALVAAAADVPELPVTMANVIGTITFTAKNKGVAGNQIPIEFINTAAGVAGVVTGMSAGATDPDIQDALDVVAGERYNIVVSPYSDATALTSLRDHLDKFAGPLEQRGAIGVSAFVGALASATTIADTINAARIVLAAVKSTRTLPIEIASAIGSAKSYIEDPAQPLNGLVLNKVAAPVVADRWTRTEQETMLHAGVTPLEVIPGEKVAVVRMISTYTEDAQGIADPSLLDITTITSLDYVRDAVRQRVALRFPAPKFTASLPKRVITEVVDVLYLLEAQEVVRDVDEWKGFVRAEGDLQDVTRLNVEIPAPVVPGAHVIAGKIDLILDNQ